MSKPKPPASEKPRPNREGIYPADTWRLSNPGYEKSAPTKGANGKLVHIEAGGWYDYEQSLKIGKK